MILQILAKVLHANPKLINQLNALYHVTEAKVLGKYAILIYLSYTFEVIIYCFILLIPSYVKFISTLKLLNTEV